MWGLWLACREPEPQLPPPDYTQPGPWAVATSVGQLPSCSLPWAHFAPERDADALVVLTHGFFRDKDVLAGLAAHLASHGLPVVTPTLCHSGPADNDPALDVLDLLSLADTFGSSRTLYAGHSAGGLRSVLAASEDPDTLAVLGLDLVDSEDLALQAPLTAPLFGLLGEPSQCNAEQNGLPVYQAHDAVTLQVAGADHCDFELPTDALCTALCDEPGAPEIPQTVLGLVTTLLLWQSGLDADAASWWTPGAEPYEELLASGAVLPR